MSEIEFNPLSGKFDFVGSNGSSSGLGSGTSTDPYVLLNVKNIPVDVYHLVQADLENIVTRVQKVDGILVVNGVNTVL